MTDPAALRDKALEIHRLLCTVYGNHEVMMLHGQRCCYYQAPACDRCVLLRLCPTGQALRPPEEERERAFVGILDSPDFVPVYRTRFIRIVRCRYADLHSRRHSRNCCDGS